MQAYNAHQMIANNVAQHGSVQNDDLVAITPVLKDWIDDGHGSTGPLVLIGYLAGEPVYRTTHTVAHHMEGNWPGAYCIHWPPLFPNVWVPECQLMQLDVTIRTEFGPPVPPPEPIDDSEYDNDISINFGGDDSDEYYDDDDDDYTNQYDDCSDLDLEYLEEIESNMSCLANVDIEWINFDSADEQ